MKDLSETVEISTSSLPWKAFLKLVNTSIIDGLVLTISMALDPLINGQHKWLLYDLKIELDGNQAPGKIRRSGA